MVGRGRTNSPARHQPSGRPLTIGWRKTETARASRGPWFPEAWITEFVELMAPTGVPFGSSVAEYTLELEGHNRRLGIQCKGASTAELAALSRALWGLDC